MRTASPRLNRYLEPVMTLARQRPWLYRTYRRCLWIAATAPRDLSRATEKVRLLETALPHTMVGHWELSNAYELCREVERRGVEGAFVECGVWKGGCAAVMASVAAGCAPPRPVWLFDSFEGLPEPTDVDGENAATYAGGRRSGKPRPIGQCVSSLAEVHQLLFSTLKLDPQRIVIDKGWFDETLPAARGRIGPIAVLRLDADWYESTKCCLENLFDSMAPGGYVIIDDYGFWPGCRKAVDEFLARRGLRVRLRRLVPPDFTDEAGVYFQVPAA